MGTTENFEKLQRSYYAYWTTDKGNYTAMRRRGYKGSLCWTVVSPLGTERRASTSYVNDQMSGDKSAYCL